MPNSEAAGARGIDAARAFADGGVDVACGSIPSSAICWAPALRGSGGVRLLELLDERGVRELVVGVFAAGVVADAERGAGRPADAESAGGLGPGAFSMIDCGTTGGAHRGQTERRGFCPKAREQAGRAASRCRSATDHRTSARATTEEPAERADEASPGPHRARQQRRRRHDARTGREGTARRRRTPGIP